MSSEKYPVAVHEAGHVIVALATTLGDKVVEADVFYSQESNHWEGRMISDFKEKKLPRSQGIERFAASIGGPLAQIKFCPESISDELRNLIEKEGGLLFAIIANQERKLGIETHWWEDLRVFIGVLKQLDPIPEHVRHLFFDITGYFEIEKVINEFLSINSAVLHQIAHELMEKDRLNSDEIWAFQPGVPPIVGLPDLPAVEV